MEHSNNNDDIQKQLDIVMAILEENQDKITDGEYLSGMNALGALHKHKQQAATGAYGSGGGGSGGSSRFRNRTTVMETWQTYDEVHHDNEMSEYIMELADDILVELCGEDASIYVDDYHYMVPRGEENAVFDLLLNYTPEFGNAGYEASPMLLHHAIQMIMRQLFKDTIQELEIVRLVTCQCGWRGTQGNWDRHITNARHQRWVDKETARKSAIRIAAAAAAEAETETETDDEETETVSNPNDSTTVATANVTSLIASIAGSPGITHDES